MCRRVVNAAFCLTDNPFQGVYDAASSRRQKMNWQNRIVADAKILAGKPLIKGTRISADLVIDLLARGYSTEQVIGQYEQLTADDIRACLAYASEVLRAEKVYAIPASA